LAAGRGRDELAAYPELFRDSWLYDDLHAARNFKPWMARSLYLGAAMFGIDQMLFRGRAPWTLGLAPDHAQLRPAAACTPIAYPKPDGVLSFDRLSSVFLSNTHHAEDQPCHLKIGDGETPIAVNLARYDAPEQRYCPAGVYEIVRNAANQPRLRINPQNCLHCKACDIKDPTQNITWVAPQGGEGPIYAQM
jgi:electron-transferring-flavoprotein dehydrogenase